MTKLYLSSPRTWGEAVLEVLCAHEQEEMALSAIYHSVETCEQERVAGNPHWRAKVRQQLQVLRDKGLVMNVRPGVWRAAASGDRGSDAA